MPVAALPAQTVSAIGSAQALTDSASLVKELVDNAIDGQANSIAVEISANTLDDVRVKDNGHGINPDDRPMVCQRHCTSKIKDFDELQTIGGRSLGFRGVALASVAEMSGSLTISTRIEGEETATEMRFDRQGRIAGEKRTFLAIGTTVRAERFLEALPVRKQSAEKTAAKTLARVRKMLQAYAFARPYLRLSLKVLKAKDQRANWKYPINAGIVKSCHDTSLFNAATDIVGKKITDQCPRIRLSWTSTGEQMEETSQALEIGLDQSSTYTIEAVLARRDCDGCIISNMGQYLSVDSRPVSCTKGTFKQIITLYKSHLRSISASGVDTKIADPFLCMNIICPPGSYDINVEPAKDDALFTDSILVLRLVENFFNSVYGELKLSQPSATDPENPPKPRGIELMLARRKASTEPAIAVPRLSAEDSSSSAQPQGSPVSESHDTTTIKKAEIVSKPPSTSITSHAKPSPASKHISTTVASPGSGENASDETLGARLARPATHPQSDDIDKASSRETKSTWKASMYDEDSDESPNGFGNSQTRSAAEDEVEEEDNLRNIEVSNPWAFAKLNASNRARGRKQHEADGSHQLLTPHRQAGDAGHSTRHLSGGFSRTSPTPPDPPPPGRSQSKATADSAFCPPASFPYPLRARGKRKADEMTEKLTSSNGETSAGGSLDAWVQKRHTSHQEDLDFSDGELVGEAIGPADIPTPRSFVSARTLPRSTPSSEILIGSESRIRKAPPQRRQQRRADDSYVAPVNDLEKVWFDIGEKPRRKQPQPTPVRQKQCGPDSLILREHGDAGSIMPSAAEGPHVPTHPDLAVTLDYEVRKQLATQQHRELLRRQAAESPNPKPQTAHSAEHTTSPHQNRQRAAIAALHTSDSPSHEPAGPPPFAPNDPRAYLIRTAQLEEEESRQNPQQRKPRRKKTSMLPFETLRSDNYVGDLIQTIDTKAIDCSTLLDKTSEDDDYVRNGIITPALSTWTAPEVQAWEATLRKLVKRQYRIEGMAPKEEMEGELDCDLTLILQNYTAEVP